MKKINYILLICSFTFLITNTSCKKDYPVYITPTPPSSTSSILLNVSAGEDKMVVLPADHCTLYGSFRCIRSLNDNFSFQWKKISGPASFVIEKPDSLGTKVSNLTIGVYSFELTVTIANATMKDTCVVTIGSISDTPTEIIFANQVWSSDGLLWGSQITINNFSQLIPAGHVFRVYIKRNNSAAWEELVFDDYTAYYSVAIMNGKLSIWSSFKETDTPDIKLVY
ncbi:MAG: hypothetical protein JST17_04555 [Bacteroidetes bacterium]|nr:hypothetical protein [Bacteroidota bacterium]MBS1929680.1 hypothetical protein [Bacteroidota bacterium]